MNRSDFLRTMLAVPAAMLAHDTWPLEMSREEFAYLCSIENTLGVVTTGAVTIDFREGWDSVYVRSAHRA